MEEEDEAIIAGEQSPQNSSDDSDESDDGRSDLSMEHYDSRAFTSCRAGTAACARKWRGAQYVVMP